MLLCVTAVVCWVAARFDCGARRLRRFKLKILNHPISCQAEPRAQLTLAWNVIGGSIAGEACDSQLPLTRRIFFLERSRALTRLASSRSGGIFSRRSSEKEARRWGAQRALLAAKSDGLLCEPAQVLRARGDREPAAGRPVSWRCR